MNAAVTLPIASARTARKVSCAPTAAELCRAPAKVTLDLFKERAKWLAQDREQPFCASRNMGRDIANRPLRAVIPLPGGSQKVEFAKEPTRRQDV